MRKVVGYEDRVSSDNRMILPGVLTTAQEIVPVTVYRPGDSALIIGHAHDLQREEDGGISFEVVHSVAVDLDDHNPLMYLSDISSKFVGGVQLFTQATIREICYSRGPSAWAD